MKRFQQVLRCLLNLQLYKVFSRGSHRIDYSLNFYSNFEVKHRYGLFTTIAYDLFSIFQSQRSDTFWDKIGSSIFQECVKLKKTKIRISRNSSVIFMPWKSELYLIRIFIIETLKYGGVDV